MKVQYFHNLLGNIVLYSIFSILDESSTGTKPADLARFHAPFEQ